jgi:hypothetical protein
MKNIPELGDLLHFSRGTNKFVRGDFLGIVCGIEHNKNIVFWLNRLNKNSFFTTYTDEQIKQCYNSFKILEKDIS